MLGEQARQNLYKEVNLRGKVHCIIYKVVFLMRIRVSNIRAPMRGKGALTLVCLARLRVPVVCTCSSILKNVSKTVSGFSPLQVSYIMKLCDEV